MVENYNMPYAKGRVVTPRNRINKIAMVLKVWFLGWRSCRASETPTQNETNATNEPPKTPLTVFFRLCQQDQFSHIQLYADLPEFYTWNRVQKVWKRRKIERSVPQYRDIYEMPANSRVYTVSPK